VSVRGPGRRSMQGLVWLARVGPASGVTWGRALGWAPPTMRSHLVRLERAGLLARVARLQGSGGPLVYATAAGVEAAGVDALAVRRAPASLTLAHHEACAQMAAYLTLRDREMLAPRELLVDERWVGDLSWREHGEVRHRRHRPDLIATVAGDRTMAIEVELTAKSAARLRSVLGLYRQWLTEGRIDSLLYVVGGERERRQLAREAEHAALERGPRFAVQVLREVQARVAGSGPPQPEPGTHGTLELEAGAR
jgi:DNA-binding MarR family transcriptional regulator